jgi:hypothetical protein
MGGRLQKLRRFPDSERNSVRCTRQWREEDLWESSERQVRGFNYMFPSAGNEQRAVVCNIGNEGSNGNELHLQVGDNKKSRDSRESCDQEITLPEGST